MPKGADRRVSSAAWAVTFGLLAALGAWWTVLIHRLVEENHVQALALHGASEALEAAFTRKRWMLLGESAFMSVLALSLVGLAWRSVVRERTNLRRLEGLLAASTHELKTPVAGVRALLESIETGVLPAHAAAPHVRRGLEACARLEHLIEGILVHQAALARPGSGLDRRTLADWVGPVLEHRLADRLDDTLDVDLGEAAGLRVAAAPDAMRVVLENLLDNARKYGRAGAVKVRARAEADEVHLEVIDQGDGFPPELAETLFEPYERGELHTTKHGTGLGLHLARVLARDVGGDLRASSPGPGMGSTFTLSLRRADG